MSIAPEIASRIKWRKIVLLNRAVLAQAWSRLFPAHDFETCRLREPRSLAAWNDPGWAKAAHDYHKERGDRVLITEPQARARPTPQVTIEAVVWCVRERGVAALNEPKNIERLCGCDEAALAQVNQRIAKLKGQGRG
jgi:hypothetical protein